MNRSICPWTAVSLGSFLLVTLVAIPLPAQEQVDLLDPASKTTGSTAQMTLQVRVTKATPAEPYLEIGWRRGGEGLGGTVTRGKFAAVKSIEPDIDRQLSGPAKVEPNPTLGKWTAPLPLETVVGRGGGWEFVTITVNPITSGPKRTAEKLTEVVVELQFSERGKPFKTITEHSPNGGTVGFAFPATLLGTSRTEFDRQLSGLSAYAKARRERLESLFPTPGQFPKQYAIIGHLGGYGEGTGYGIRHCNPEIVAEECRTLELLGVNALVGGRSQELANKAGMGKSFLRLNWEGPGSGSPMAYVSSDRPGEPDGCPFDEKLQPQMAERVSSSIQQHKATGARETWALWWDEIGVAVKEHMNDCPRCKAAFVKYVQSCGVTPQQLGAASWAGLQPYPLFTKEIVRGTLKDKTLASGEVKQTQNATPETREEKLRYYYTYRFMTYATAQLFPPSAATFKAQGIPLYAMQGPTPSWSGHSLDWHEFYDRGANTAMVWETSNRDARVWQWESYLGDIARGIAARHEMPIGCLVKPHRGAPAQRFLSVITRGATAIEWYTYGPDYSKGDSFSQSPELLERVAKAGRFLGAAEPWLYGAKLAKQTEVAFVSPRSSEIWTRAGDLGSTAFEDAKWVYMALAHAHVPMDVISEAQLAEGELTKRKYKALYIIGPNLQQAAAKQVTDWVRAGGTLWTGAMGLARDEANEPAAISRDVLGLADDRQLESWGKAEGYKATSIGPFAEKDVPQHAALQWKLPTGSGELSGQATASVGREVLSASGAEVLATFADGKPAVIRRKVGSGQVILCGFWPGLTYSAKVRRDDFDMQQDYDPTLRSLIASAAILAGAARPARPSDAQVEAVVLDNAGKRSVALMNWAYHRPGGAAKGKPQHQPVENLVVELDDIAGVTKARAILQGELPLKRENGVIRITLPRMEEIDLVVLE